MTRISGSILIAAAFASGIYAAGSFQFDAAISIACGVGGVMLLMAGWVHLRRKGRSEFGEPLPSPAIWAMAAVLAGCAGIGFVRMAAEDVRLSGPSQPSMARLEGKVASDPRSVRGSSRLILASSEGRVWLGVYGRLPELELGDTIAVSGKLQPLRRDDRFHRYLRTRGVEATMSTSADDVVLRRTATSPVHRVAGYFRRQLIAGSRNNLGSDGALLTGLTIGEDSQLPEKVREEFRASGLTHLTAVSGANLAVVLAALLIVLRALAVPRAVQSACGVVVVLFFATVARWEPSVLRASVVACLVLGSFFFGRKRDPLHLLCLSFAGILAFEPILLWSVGFQLSYAATAGILVGSRRIEAALGRFPKPVRAIVGVTVAAQIAVAPLAALHFGRLSLTSLPANFLAFPLAGPAVVLGLLAGILACLWMPLSTPVFAAAGLFVSGIRLVAHWMGSSIAYLPVPDWDAAAAITAYVVLLLLICSGRARWLAAGVVLVVATSSAASAYGRPQPELVRITFFNVGQGDSALVESKEGAAVLIDAGPDEREVSAALRRRGIKRLDIGVMSHGHRDHAAGFAGIVSASRVRRLLHPGPSNAYEKELRRLMPLEVAREGDKYAVGDLVFEVLGPDPELLTPGEEISERGEGSALNDASLVLRVSWGFGCALFTGDVEERAQLQLIEGHRTRIRCAVMKAPHHGSARLLEEFVGAVDPQIVTVSVGPNEYGHPSPSALRMFEREGARIYRTDRLGEIVVEADAAGRLRVGADRL